MKPHLAKVSLALLSTVFLLGCQEQGSGPSGPEGPQFDKKGEGDCGPMGHDFHCHEGSKEETKDINTFTAIFQVDVTGGAGTIDTEIGERGALSGPSSSGDGIFGGGTNPPKSPEPIVLTFNDFLHSVDGGDICFPVGDYGGILAISQNTPGSDEARIQYNFKANGTDGTPDIGYTLILRGLLDPDAYAPVEVGDEATIDGLPGTFEVAPSHGPGKISCKGTGSVSFSILVTRIT